MLREFVRNLRLISWRYCRWAAIRIFSLLAILLNLIALNACISASAVSPERRQGSDLSHSSQTIQTHMTFKIEPYGSGESQHYVAGDRGHGGAPGIRKVFEESFAGATYVLTPRTTGTHVHTEVLRKPFFNSELSYILSRLTLASLAALPFYHDWQGYVVLYHLYLDGKLQSTYRYEITEKGIVWLPLGLFAWVNYFTTGETEAFEETARQFVADAERDGYFRGPSP